MNLRRRRSSLAPISPSELKPDFQLDKLIKKIFDSIPDKDSEQKSGESLVNFTPPAFDGTVLKDPSAYAVTVKKVIYELLLFVKEKGLHLFPSLSRVEMLKAGVHLRPYLSALSPSWRISLINSDVYSLTLSLQRLLLSIINYKCELFLMAKGSPPKDSNRMNLYLYEDKEGFYYFNSGVKHVITETQFPSQPLVFFSGGKKYFQNIKDLFAINPTEDKNIFSYLSERELKACEDLLKIITKQGHFEKGCKFFLMSLDKQKPQYLDSDKTQLRLYNIHGNLCYFINQEPHYIADKENQTLNDILCNMFAKEPLRNKNIFDLPIIHNAQEQACAELLKITFNKGHTLQKGHPYEELLIQQLKTLENSLQDFELQYIHSRAGKYFIENIECSEYFLFKLEEYFEFLKDTLNTATSAVYNPNAVFGTLENIEIIVNQLINSKATKEEKSKKEKILLLLKNKLGMVAKEIEELKMNSANQNYVSEDLQALFDNCMKVINAIKGYFQEKDLSQSLNEDKIILPEIKYHTFIPPAPVSPTAEIESKHSKPLQSTAQSSDAFERKVDVKESKENHAYEIFTQKLTDFYSYIDELDVTENIFHIFNHPNATDKTGETLAHFYGLELQQLLQENQQVYAFLDNPLLELRNEKFKFNNQLLTPLQHDQMNKLEHLFLKAKKHEIPNAETILKIFSNINNSDKPLELKKQFGKQIAANFIPKITSLKEIAKFIQLFNQRDFLRRKRGFLKNCTLSYGDTDSLKFVLNNMRQRIQELVKNSQAVAELSDREKAQINYIMNYQKNRIETHFDINDSNLKFFADKLIAKYNPNKIGFFQKDRIKECQKKLFSKMIELLNNPNISNEEIRIIQQDFLHHNIAHLGAKIGKQKAEIGERYSTYEGHLMNAILNDIIKYKEKRTSFNCVDNIEKNYLALQKIYSSSLPPLAIIYQLKQFQGNYINRLRKRNG